MTSFQPGLYVHIDECDNSPMPSPLDSNFSTAQVYCELGLNNPSETSDAHFVLNNDHDKLWFFCNRHVRSYALPPGERALILPIGGTARKKVELV